MCKFNLFITLTLTTVAFFASGCGDKARDSLDLNAKFLFADGQSPIAGLNIIKYDITFKLRTGSSETYTLLPRANSVTNSDGIWTAHAKDMNLQSSSEVEICNQICTVSTFNHCERYVISCHGSRPYYNVYDILSAYSVAYYKVGNTVIETPLQASGYVPATAISSDSDGGMDSDASINDGGLQPYPNVSGYTNPRLWTQTDIFITPFQNWSDLTSFASSSAVAGSTAPLITGVARTMTYQEFQASMEISR